MVTNRRSHDEWAFLLHRLPREPSAPRISLWRAIRRLGAVLVADGLVALPASARTIEHFEWLAAGIRENDGEASVWVARSTTRLDSERLARLSREATESDYVGLIQDAEQALAESSNQLRSLRRLRRQLRVVESRDFFSAPSGERARTAVENLARVKVTA